MNDWPEGVTNIDATTDITESPDEDGFYVSSYKPRRTSIIYPTFAEALKAYRTGKVRWNK
jgi:hypothetical protein